MVAVSGGVVFAQSVIVQGNRRVDAETIRSMVAMGLGVSIANAVPHPTTRSFHGLPVNYVPLINPEVSNTIIAVTRAETRMSKKLTTALSTLRATAEETNPLGWHAGHQVQP